jgi:hypothetical protein
MVVRVQELISIMWILVNGKDLPGKEGNVGGTRPRIEW